MKTLKTITCFVPNLILDWKDSFQRHIHNLFRLIYSKLMQRQKNDIITASYNEFKAIMKKHEVPTFAGQNFANLGDKCATKN